MLVGNLLPQKGTCEITLTMSEHSTCSVNDISLCNYSRENNCSRPDTFILWLYSLVRGLFEFMICVETGEHVLCSVNDIPLCNYSRENNCIRPVKLILRSYILQRDLRPQSVSELKNTCCVRCMIFLYV
jgi:hypothetical protein